MNVFISRIGKIDFLRWATVSLFVVWPALTFSIALAEIALVTALIFWLCHSIRAGAPKLDRFDWVLWSPLILFVGLVVLSFFLSEYPKESFKGLQKIGMPLILLIMTADCFRRETIQKQFLVCFTATFLLVLIDSSIQYAFGRDLLRFFPAQSSGAGLRLVGPFGDYGKMGSYLIEAIPILSMLFLTEFRKIETKRHSFYFFALIIAGFILLYLTRSRGAILACAISFLGLCIYRRWFKFLGIAVLLVCILLAFTPRSMIFHLDATQKEQSMAERFDLWKRALNVIEAKPWTGTGINTYNVAHAKYDKEKSWRVRGYYAHNGYLQLTAEAGIPCILSLFWFLIIFFKKALGHIQSAADLKDSLLQAGILTGLLAFLIHAFYDTALQSPQSLMRFWYLAGVLLAFQSPATEQKLRSDNSL